ncbi:MAG TPA: hypothetical protein VGK49_07135, partial [Ilumatobacteraceae bacterium]
VRFEQVAELAGSRAFHLRSAFRPTYNMAANLVRTYDAEEAHHLLNLSFAQFQSDRDVVRLEARLERLRARLTSLRDEATSPYGDIDELRRLRDESRGPRLRDDPTELALIRLRPGSVVYANKGKYRGPVAVVATAHRKGGMRLTAITPGGDSLQLTASDFTLPPAQIGAVELPSGYAPQRREYRREVGRRVREARLTPRQSDRVRAPIDGEPHGAPTHPVEADPHLRDRLRAAAQADRVQGEIASLEEKVRHRNQSLSAELDSVLGVLSSYGYVDVRAWRLTEAGEMLARTFHECDLLVAECVRQGLLDGLTPSELAGVVSVFVHEHRSPDDPPRPWFPSADVRRRWIRIAEVSDELVRAEIAAGLAEHRPPDPGFIAVAYAWVAGEGFAAVVEDEELTGGDFVREMKQLIDLLSQIAIIAPDPSTRAAASKAANSAFRGVVADSSSPTSTTT